MTATMDEYVARVLAAQRAALEVPLDQRAEDPRVAKVLQLVAAAYASAHIEPCDRPVDPVDLVRWFVGMFAGRGIDLDIISVNAEHDVATTMIPHAYRGQEGTC